MSYSIHVYPIELLNKTISENMDFHEVLEYIEKEQNLLPFSAEQMTLIEDHLDYRGFKLERKSLNRKDYSHPKFSSISAMVTPAGVYFDARGEDVLDMTLTAGEFGYSGSLKGEFGVFDSGNGGWQK